MTDSPKFVIRWNLDDESISIGKSSMFFKEYGDFKIFRPRREVEAKLLSEEAAFVYEKHKPGKYVIKDEINSVLQTIFAFHKPKLEDGFQKLATRDYITFLLWQYDQSHHALMEGRGGRLPADQWQEWNLESRIVRRALKYLTEKVCGFRLAAEQIEDEDELLSQSEMVQICAEEFVRLSVMSDSTFAIFGDETELTLNTSDSSDLLEMKVLNKSFQSWDERIAVDGKNKSKFLSGRPIDSDVDEQDKYLGDTFAKVHGIRFSAALELLSIFSKCDIPDNMNPFDGCFFDKNEVISMLSKETKIDSKTVEKIIAGFTIKPEVVVEKPGQPWNPKRTHAANKRALFEVPHPDGVCLAWSRCMAFEALRSLQEGAVFKKLPREWAHASLVQPLEDLHAVRGKWFENTTIERLKNIGFVGRFWKDKIGALAIPAEVGEIDCIGYSVTEKRLLILECKMTQYSPEPRTWRSDLERYLTAEDNHVDKFRRKRDWILANLTSICREINQAEKLTMAPDLVSSAMVTYHPNISSCFIDDFPCVSLTELMIAAKEAKGWPYALGTVEIT